jgi:diadenosine tetraphosphate (Ap4A) HIT family hydrolase
MTDCYVCRKHLGEIVIPGGAVYGDEHLYIGHAFIPKRPEGSQGETTAYLGAMLVEPKRHVPGLADLTEIEAQRVGVLINRLSRALMESEGAEHVYLFALGHQACHLHIWVVPRYPGTPREYWGTRVDEWPEAPRGGPLEIEALCRRLTAWLDPVT